MLKIYILQLTRTLPNVAKYLIAFAAVGAVSFLFPTTAKFKYRFEKGSLWNYEDLNATFDFAIKKTANELEAERTQLEQETPPHYEIDLAETEKRKKDFEQNFEDQLISIIRRDKQNIDVLKAKNEYFKFGNDLLERWLYRGIVEADSMLRAKDKNFIVHIVRGNTVEKQTFQTLSTYEKIKIELGDTLQKSPLKDAELLYSLLESSLTPNLRFNAELTKKYKQQQLEEIAQSRGMVRRGELIVRKNALIDDYVYQKILSYKEQYETETLGSRKFYLVFGGYCLFIGTLVWLFMRYLCLYAPPVFARIRWVIFLMLWVVLYTYLLYLTKVSGVMSLYVLPFCIVPIVVKNFYDRELALLTHILTVITAVAVVSPNFEFCVLQIAGGLIAIYFHVETRYWGGFFRSIFFIILTYACCYIGFALAEEGTFTYIEWRELFWLPLNGLLTMLAYPLIPLLGSLFGFTSNIHLAELSDLNNPLLSELSAKAPGTLQHSLQVAHLAEKAALAVRANAILVKVAALYHDIGKTLNPMYFIENQSDNNNPHDQMPPLDSARVIIDHVTEGVKLAHRYSLPDELINFIKTHHGTTSVEYFYRMYLRQYPDREADRYLFCYPGPTPQSREEAILMLADSIEAAAKSLREKTVASIDDLVERICSDKIANGQFRNAAISFRDLEQCKAVFKQTLKSIYHLRVEYPKK